MYLTNKLLRLPERLWVMVVMASVGTREARATRLGMSAAQNRGITTFQKNYADMG